MSHKRYEKISFIGEGQFATVYKARDKETDRVVAIKKIKIGNYEEAKDGVNRTALREIKLLRELYHENVIALLDVYGKDSSISLVFDIMEYDLEQIIHERKIWLSFGHIKSYLLMTLKGVEFLHQNFILHRDLKPNNLLLDKNNVLKIADFGLARTYGSPSRVYSHQVVTRWYRAPELLYGSRKYGGGIDIWAIGCILAELFGREPLFPGDSDLDTLDKIVTLLGTPTEENWRGVTQLPDYVKFNDDVPRSQPLSERYAAVPQEGLDILESMLRLDPNERCDATEALKMPYFSTKPFPTPPSMLPRFKDKKDDEHEAGNGAAARGGAASGDDDDDDGFGANDRSGDFGGSQKSTGSLDTKFDIKLEPNADSNDELDLKPTSAKRLKFERY